jgi:hypothetical protein
MEVKDDTRNTHGNGCAYGCGNSLFVTFLQVQKHHETGPRLLEGTWMGQMMRQHCYLGAATIYMLSTFAHIEC